MASVFQPSDLPHIKTALDRLLGLDRYWGGLIPGLIVTKMFYRGAYISAEQLAGRCEGMSDDTARRKLRRMLDIGLVCGQPAANRRGWVFQATPEAAAHTLDILESSGWDYRKIRH